MDDHNMGMILAALEGLRQNMTDLSVRLSKLDSSHAIVSSETKMMERRLEEVRESVSRIDATLHRDNGRPALTTRVFTVEQIATQAAAKAEAAHDRISKTARAALDAETAGRWKLWITVVSGVLGIISVIVTSLVAKNVT